MRVSQSPGYIVEGQRQGRLHRLYMCVSRGLSYDVERQRQSRLHCLRMRALCLREIQLIWPALLRGNAYMRVSQSPDYIAEGQRQGRLHRLYLCVSWGLS
jgi:hypothetical protein